MVTRIQYARQASTTSPVTITLGNTPQAGDVLVLAYGSEGFSTGTIVYYTISNIQQQGVTWSKVIGKTNSYSGKSAYYTVDSEIWFGVVAAGASATITVTLSGSPGTTGGAVCDVCEYSGVVTSNYIDQTATNAGSGTTPDTGTTPNTTQASELWVGSTVDVEYAQSSPTNGFTLLDGASYNAAVSEAYLEKTVTSQGAAHSSTTCTSTLAWAGCIATFKAVAAGVSLKERQGDGLTFSEVWA
jgi:hypothetical protein